MKTAILLILAAGSLAWGQNRKGHYEYQPADKWDCAYYNWVPPSDCNTWPKGMIWAGGVVYDHHGCVYPKIDGKCDAEIKDRVPSCSENPPKPPPRIKDRHCPQ